MNDETQQMRERLFDQITGGLAMIGLVLALSTLVMGGLSSPWFWPAIALIIVALVTFGLRRVSQLVVAAYVLVLELTGLVAALLIRANTFSFIPYLFVPIVVIAGLTLSQTATMAIGLSAILLVVALIALTQQLTWGALLTLLPPVSLIILAALLVIEGKRYVENLGDRLIESRKLLRERTLEMMEAETKIAELQTKAEDLKQQLLNKQAETQQVQQIANQKSQGLYELIKGALQELDTTTETLENLIDQVNQQPSADEQAVLLEQIWQKIYHLNNLIINLEDMAQLKNNHITLTYQPVDVAHLVREVVSTARGLARGKAVEIRAQLPENLPKIPLDPVRIRQALLYVLNNAVKYTDQGIIEVQAELNPKELLLFVSDTGIGMHREEMELVFNEFGRGSGSLAKQRQGTGLGLAISKGLVELHNGHMWVTSVLGVGSTFYINLPLEQPGRQAPVAVTAPATLAQPATGVAAPAFETIIAEGNGKAVQPAKTGFGSPVGRYTPTYISRFGFILLALLFVIASAVALLAVLYGPVNEEAAAGELASPTLIAKLPDTATPEPTTTPEPTIIPALPTATPPQAALPTFTPTLSPTPEPSDTPTKSPTPAPTATPTTASVTSTPTTTPTPVPPSPTPKAVQTPPTEVSAQPAALRRSVQGLSFIANQTIARQTQGGKLITLDAAGPVVDDSDLSWSPDGRQVLFTSVRDGNYEVYIANADGQQAQNLTHSPGYDGQPAWSPDSRTIAFSSERNGNVDIYLMDATGGNLRQLTTDRGYDEWPAWSPDGRTIAFVADQDGNNEIYTIKVNGENAQRLTNNKADDWPVSWSPDGRTLVFGSNRDGNWNLYVVASIGGEATRLTDDPADEREPVWSPDGRAIAFASNVNGNWDIYTLPAPSGSGKVSVTPTSQWTQVTNTPAINEHYPVWIP